MFTKSDVILMSTVYTKPHLLSNPTPPTSNLATLCDHPVEHHCQNHDITTTTTT